jgi:hypothetical protein
VFLSVLAKAEVPSTKSSRVNNCFITVGFFGCCVIVW